MSSFPKFNALPMITEEDDLYITAMGFEDRSLGSNKDLLDNNFKSKYGIVIRYTDYIKENERQREELEKILKQLTKEYTLVSFDTSNRDTFIADFKKAFNSILHTVKSITINISSLITFPLIWIINFAFDNVDKIRIVYTEPEGYDNQLEKEHAFSSGVKEIFTMQEFAGSHLPGYLSSLVIFLGYDFIRARGILEQIQPSNKVGILAKPNTPKLLESFSKMEKEHRKSFGSNDDVKLLSLFDLDEVINELSKLRSDSIETSNIMIALNGAKLHHIGALLFVKKYKDAQLILSSPLEYYPNSYSYGKRRTFEIIFRRNWIEEFLQN